MAFTKPKKPMFRLIAENAPNLADIRRAAEGLETLQKEIAASSKAKKSISWKAFKSAVEEGRK